MSVSKSFFLFFFCGGGVIPREPLIQLGGMSFTLAPSSLLLPGTWMKCLELQQLYCNLKVTLKIEAVG